MLTKVLGGLDPLQMTADISELGGAGGLTEVAAGATVLETVMEAEAGEVAPSSALHAIEARLKAGKRCVRHIVVWRQRLRQGMRFLLLKHCLRRSCGPTVNVPGGHGARSR